MKDRTRLALCGALSILVAGIGFKPAATQAAPVHTQATVSLSLANAPDRMRSGQTGIVTATLSSAVKDGRISFSEAYNPALGGQPLVQPIYACTPVGGACSMTWAPPPGYTGTVTVSAVWSGDKQFAGTAKSMQVPVTRSRYLYTGIWQGNGLAPMTQVVPALTNPIAGNPSGQLTQFATKDPAYGCLAGQSLPVYLAPQQFPGDYVVYSQGQSSCPAGTWLFPQAPAITGAPGSANAGKPIHLAGRFPAARPADATVTFLGVQRIPGQILSWSAAGIDVMVPAGLLSGRYAIALSWHDAGTTATVTNASSPVSVQVAGLVIPAQAAPGARVLDSATLKTLAPLRSKLPRSATLFFKNNTPFLKSLKPGSVIVAGKSLSTPLGFLRKVTRISQPNPSNSVAVDTVPATLHDVIVQGSYDFQRPLTARTVQSFTPALPGVTMQTVRADGSPCLNVPNLSLYKDNSGNSATLSGQACFTSNIDVSGYFNTHGAGASITVSGGDTAHLQVTGTGHADFNTQLTLGSFILDPIVFSIGPIPVVIVPEIDITVGAQGNIRASITLGATQKTNVTVSAGCGIRWFPPDASCDADAGIDNSFTVDPITANANAQVTAYATIDAKALLYGVAGGGLELQGYIEGDVDTQADPWWSIYAGLRLKAFFELDLFGVGTKTVTLADWRWLIAQADGPLPGETVSLSAAPLQPICRKGTPFHGEPIVNCNPVTLTVTASSVNGPLHGDITFSAPDYDGGPTIGTCTLDVSGTCSISWHPKDTSLGAGDEPGTYEITARTHGGTVSQPVSVNFVVVR